MVKYISGAILFLVIAGCTSPFPPQETATPVTKSNTPTVTDHRQPLSAVYTNERCRLSAPNSSADHRNSRYPEIPRNLSDSAVEQYVIDFERALVYNEYYDGDEDKFYVTFKEKTVIEENESIQVKIGTVHMVEVKNETPGDQWYSVTYTITRDGMTRTVGSRTDPPDKPTNNYVTICQK